MQVKIFQDATLSLRERNRRKVAPSSFLKKRDFGITKNYRGIVFTPIPAKAYNALFLNCIKPVIKKILWEDQKVWRNWFTNSKILTICQIIKGVCERNPETTLLFINFYKAFDFIY